MGSKHDCVAHFYGDQRHHPNGDSEMDLLLLLLILRLLKLM